MFPTTSIKPLLIPGCKGLHITSRRPISWGTLLMSWGPCRGDHVVRSMSWDPCRGYMSWGTSIISWGTTTMSWMTCTHDILAYVPTICEIHPRYQPRYPRHMIDTHDINPGTHDIILLPTTSNLHPRHTYMLTYRGYISWGTCLMSWGTFVEMHPRYHYVTHDIIMYPRHQWCLGYIWNVTHDMVPTTS